MTIIWITVIQSKCMSHLMGNYVHITVLSLFYGFTQIFSLFQCISYICHINICCIFIITCSCIIPIITYFSAIDMLTCNLNLIKMLISIIATKFFIMNYRFNSIIYSHKFILIISNINRIPFFYSGFYHINICLIAIS